MPENHAGHAHDGHDHPYPHGGTTPVLHLPAGGRPLTPAEVRNKVFATVRVREGYDMAQVDEFLDLVEATLDQVLRENAELRTRPAQSPAGDGAPRLTQHAAERTVTMATQQAKEIIADARERAEAAQREALTYGGRIREGLQDQIRQLRALLIELEKKTTLITDLGPPSGRPAPNTRLGDVS
ncbi:DivIVA domain-containing protein [Actinoallomurus iriomotensis]|uniref:Cell wall synthesis protein Wag31 n=1 Tax=Actinoallomurus iriomotensis TaxID=478107 RepID=A0A9W6S9T8_9ACTN|nr:DivIVA domain-containing protein [Actinoallomurus iriomotensis]GLY88360.1 hypothetical protein Airi02_062890 [Actinoallomurus iriomotensis]